MAVEPAALLDMKAACAEWREPVTEENIRLLVETQGLHRDLSDHVEKRSKLLLILRLQRDRSLAQDHFLLLFKSLDSTNSILKMAIPKCCPCCLKRQIFQSVSLSFDFGRALCILRHSRSHLGEP